MQCECPLGFTLILLDFYCCTRVAQTHARLRPATAVATTAYADGNSRGGAAAAAATTTGTGLASESWRVLALALSEMARVGVTALHEAMLEMYSAGTVT